MSAPRQADAPPHPAERRATAASATLAALLCALAWAWLPFGIDHYDQGYVLSAAGLLLDHPEDVVPRQTGGIWLTLLAVAGLLGLGGDHGVLLVRLAVVPVALAVSAIGCLIVRRRATLPAVLAIGAAAHVLARSWRVDGFLSYPILSSLCFALAVLLLMEGAERNRRRWLAAGGLTLGVAPFFRLPNAAGAVLLALPLLHQLLSGRGLRCGLRQSLWGAAGTAAGIAGVATLMAGLGHAGLFVEGIREMAAIAAGEDSPYRSTHLALEMAADVVLSVVCAAPLLLLALGAGAAAAGLPAGARALIVAAAACVGLLLLRGYLPSLLVPYGVVFLALAVPALLPGRSARDRAIDVGALGVLLLVPLGAATGIRTAAATAVLFAGPVAATSVWQVLGAGASYPRRAGLLAACAVAAALFLNALLLLPATSRDASGFTTGPGTSTNAKLRGILMDPLRARRFDEAAAALRRHADPGDLVVAAGHIPLLYLLTDTRPFLGDLWPLAREAGYVGWRLPERVAERGELPVVLLASEDSLRGNWPAPDPARPPSERVLASLEALARRLPVLDRMPFFYRGALARRDALLRRLGIEPLLSGHQNAMIRDNRRALEAFLYERGYHREWTNQSFALWVPIAAPGRDPRIPALAPRASE